MVHKKHGILLQEMGRDVHTTSVSGPTLPVHNIGLHVRHTDCSDPITLWGNVVIDLDIVIVKDEGHLDLDDKRHKESIKHSKIDFP
jgi:hypothetical protein